MKARHATVRHTILAEICKLNVLSNKEEMSLRHVAMVAKFLDLNKPCSWKYGRKKKKKWTCMTFLYMVALRNKTIAHTFLSPLDNSNGRLCQERLLRYENFATMVTRRHTSLLCIRYTCYNLASFSTIIFSSHIFL